LILLHASAVRFDEANTKLTSTDELSPGDLPCISSFTPGTPLATHLLQHGQYNSSFWILSVNSKEFNTALKTNSKIIRINLMRVAL
jgi:hypothetical protein